MKYNEHHFWQLKVKSRPNTNKKGWTEPKISPLSNEIENSFHLKPLNNEQEKKEKMKSSSKTLFFSQNSPSQHH